MRYLSVSFFRDVEGLLSGCDLHLSSPVDPHVATGRFFLPWDPPNLKMSKRTLVVTVASVAFDLGDKVKTLVDDDYWDGIIRSITHGNISQVVQCLAVWGQESPRDDLGTAPWELHQSTSGLDKDMRKQKYTRLCNWCLGCFFSTSIGEPASRYMVYSVIGKWAVFTFG